MVYESRWRKALLLAVAFHAGAGLLFAAAAPMLFPKAPVADVVELEWAPSVNTGETGDDAIGGGGQGGGNGAGSGDGTAPEIPAVQTVAETGFDISEETVLTDAPAIETEAVPMPKDSAVPRIASGRDEAAKELEKSSSGGNGNGNPLSVLFNANSGPKMGRSAKLLYAEYPAAGMATYKGRVNLSACIGRDGKIRYAEVVHSSGSKLVDAIAMQCAMKWKYRPATDSDGAPMECNALISIPFREKKAK